VTQRSFIERRQRDWKELEQIIGGGTKELKAGAENFPRMLRKLTGDLNTARSNGFDPSLIERLNRLILEGNQLLYRGKPFRLSLLSDFMFKTFPGAVRSQWRSLGVCFLIFYGLAVFSALLVIRFPGFIHEIMPYRTVKSLERMYDPADEQYLKPREVSNDADMFGFYIYNNISIAFRIFGSGILAGAGSLFMLAFNAVFLGAAEGHIINRGFTETFYSFVSGHSSLELTAIIFSAQAGLLLGWRLFITRGLSRGASVREAGKTALPIIGGSALMLVLAAAVEAFWSSRHEIPPPVHYAAGGLITLALLAYFLFAGRGKSSPAGPKEGGT
jgi:uncharacterized membrane protein SpoIIM required for sporulation